MACHTKPWRSMVEAMGIEPMSAKRTTTNATCLVFGLYSVPSQKRNISTETAFVYTRATQQLNPYARVLSFILQPGPADRHALLIDLN